MSKLVLVSGGGRGLGAEICKQLVGNGYLVAINYKTSYEAAMKLATDLGGDSVAKPFHADISEKSDVDKMFAAIEAHFGNLPEILINNALADFKFNGDARKKVDELSWTDVQSQLDVTVKGSLNLIQGLLPSMKKKSYGKIINIGTNLFQNPVVPYHEYIIAKGAMVAMTRSFAKDLGPFGIRVNMVSGGLLKTTDASSCTPPEVFDFVASTTPLQEVTTVEGFAEGLMFFVQKQSDAVTGQSLTIDGGLTFT